MSSLEVVVGKWRNNAIANTVMLGMMFITLVVRLVTIIESVNEGASLCEKFPAI